MIRQGIVLDRIIRKECGDRSLFVLDCTCGIGTQAIGLALHGHTVYGTDVAEAAIKRATSEAKTFGAAITFAVADVRHLESVKKDSFDVVISCDNALAHLHTEREVKLAARAIRSKLRIGGLLVATLRDYDHLLKERPHATLPEVFDDPLGSRIVFQTWHWEQRRPVYSLNLFIIQKTRDKWAIKQHSGICRAWTRMEISSTLRSAGFSGIRWRMPAESGYYQPLVTARHSATITRH